MNFDRLRFVADRAGFGENSEVLVCVVIPERPNSFLDLYQAIDPRPVTEFSYRYGSHETANIFLSLLVKDHDREIKEVFTKLEGKGMKAVNATRNELAKTHGRFLVGGRNHVVDERMFRFTFPERPGALKHFLESLHQTRTDSHCAVWNSN